MEEYEEYYWLNSEVPEDRVEDMFDWMFEEANRIYSEESQTEVERIIKSN